MAEDTQTTQISADASEALMIQEVTKHVPVSVVLTQEEILGTMSQFGDKSTYRTDSRMQGDYYTFRFRGSMFIASPEFQKAFKERKVLQCTLSSTKYIATVADPLNAGKTTKQLRSGWSLDAFLTTEDSAAILETKKAAMRGNFALKAFEQKISDAESRLKPEDVKMTDDEFNELLSSI